MLVGVGSVKGSPGVSTVALGLATGWPEPARAVLVEADPAGGDVAMRFALAAAPGLVSLAAEGRRADVVDPAQLWRHSQALASGAAVVAAPPDAHQARAAVAALSSDGGPGVLRAAADRPGAVVVVDCGRVDPGSPAAALMRGADAMVILARPQAEELAHLVRRLSEFGQWARHPVLVLTGPGYADAEVARELGVAVLARLPHDPAGAAVLSGHRAVTRRGRRGAERSALGRAAGRLAESLIQLAAVDSASTTSTGAPASAGRSAGPAPRRTGVVPTTSMSELSGPGRVGEPGGAAW